MRWMRFAARWRLAAVLAGILVVALAAYGVDRVVAGHGRADRDAGADRDAVGADHDSDQGDEADEEDGGPQAPADYLTLKWTSGRDVSPAQVARSIQQAAAMPQGAGGS